MKEIQVGTGLGSIKFGFTRDAIEKVMGKPDEKDTFSNSEEENDQSEVWHFDDLEQSFSFDEIDEWKLTSIACSSEDISIKGKKVIGLHFDEALDILETLELGEMEIEDVAGDDSPDQQVVAFPDSSINFWFEAGILTEIQWGPFWNDEEGEPIWPN